MAEVEFRDVTRRYPGGVVALNGFNLTVADGEFLILVGPSGCGKSTALRLLAGLDKPTSGEIRIGSTVVNGLAPGERDIAMVFQNYALYPHMSVYRNLAYGLRQRKTPRTEVERRVVRQPSCWRSISYSTASPASSPAANVNGSRWAVRSFVSHRPSCSTNRCRTSTRNCATRFEAT